jgi:hypothetical protein
VLHLPTSPIGVVRRSCGTGLAVLLESSRRKAGDGMMLESLGYKQRGVYMAGNTKSPSLSIGTTRLRALFLPKD